MKIYCLTYKNPNRKAEMQQRFEKLDLQYEFVESVAIEDVAISTDVIAQAKHLKLWYPKPFSIMAGFLLVLEKIVSGNEEISIVVEDDVQLRKDFSQLLPSVLDNFQRIAPDVMMLVYQNYNFNHPLSEFGYLISQLQPAPDFKTHRDQRTYYDARVFQHETMPVTFNKIWGTQMFMITKTFAQHVLTNYGLAYAESAILDQTKNVWSPDSIINKIGKTALINPMMGVECFVDLNYSLQTQLYEGFTSTEAKINHVSEHVERHNTNRFYNYNKDLHF
jgi:GR25 family glycosyltransferase involved in LPS biosynthesis